MYLHPSPHRRSQPVGQALEAADELPLRLLLRLGLLRSQGCLPLRQLHLPLLRDPLPLLQHPLPLLNPVYPALDGYVRSQARTRTQFHLPRLLLPLHHPRLPLRHLQPLARGPLLEPVCPFVEVCPPLLHVLRSDLRHG